MWFQGSSLQVEMTAKTFAKLGKNLEFDLTAPRSDPEPVRESSDKKHKNKNEDGVFCLERETAHDEQQKKEQGHPDERVHMSHQPSHPRIALKRFAPGSVQRRKSFVVAVPLPPLERPLGIADNDRRCQLFCESRT